MKYRSLLAAAAALIISLPAGAQIRALRQVELKNWEFSKNGTDWQNVTIPHSYNAEDGHSARYYRGDATYRCDVKVNDLQKDHYLLFEGAAQGAVVMVNGETVATHQGGYTPFVVKLNGFAKKGDNHVEVICNNEENVDRIPLTSDFNKNGGLHNQAWFLDMDDIYFSPEDYGIYRLRCETPEVSPNKFSTDIKAKIVNSSNKDTKVLVRVQLLEANGALGYQADREVTVQAFSDYDFEHDFDLRGLRLWNGTKDPYLYTVRLEMFKGKRMMDIAESKIGYRYYGYDPEQGFLLNGKPYPLHGVAIHQDTDGKASAMTAADYRRDYRLVKEVGANFVRMAHYPHNDIAYQLCDSLGIVVQTEVPWVNECGVDAKQAYFNNIRHQMGEMITNLYNHPCIIFWGMWNEVGNVYDYKPQGVFDAPKVVLETEKLYEYAKSLDPQRFVGFTDCSGLERPGYTDLKSDFCSQNVYYGWYWKPGEFDGFTERMNKVRAIRGNSPVSVAEYGAGNNPFCHVWDMSKAVRNKEEDSKHYEEYADLFHESYARQIKAMPWLCFTSLWVMFDFPVASRMEGYMDSDDGEHFTSNSARKFMNDKGIVTRDRQTKKDVFYLYKSLWNKDETTVCIVSSRLKYYPADKDLVIKVYSNAKNLTLYQNDKVVTRKVSSEEPTGVIWTFPAVRLKTAKDTFKVVANDGTTAETTLSRL